MDRETYKLEESFALWGGVQAGSKAVASRRSQKPNIEEPIAKLICPAKSLRAPCACTPP